MAWPPASGCSRISSTRLRSRSAASVRVSSVFSAVTRSPTLRVYVAVRPRRSRTGVSAGPRSASLRSRSALRVSRPVMRSFIDGWNMPPSMICVIFRVTSVSSRSVATREAVSSARRRFHSRRYSARNSAMRSGGNRRSRRPASTRSSTSSRLMNLRLSQVPRLRPGHKQAPRYAGPTSARRGGMSVQYADLPGIASEALALRPCSASQRRRSGSGW